MRHFLFVIAASTTLPACLPDPANLFYKDEEPPKESDASYDYNYNEGDDPMSEISPEDEESRAMSSFVFDGAIVPIVPVEEASDDGMDAESNIQDYRYFGKNNLSLYCEESEGAETPIGHAIISVESAPTATPDKVSESWKQRLEIPCAGKVSFKYYGLVEAHTYKVKIEQLEVDGVTLKKTLNGTFATPDPITEDITFEIK